MRRFSKLPGRVKGLFLALRLHVLIPIKTFSFLTYMAKMSRWRKQNPPMGMCDFYSPKFDYAKRFQLFEHIIEAQKLDTSIDYLEFGVSTGNSFRWWINRLKNDGARFYGFDTFTGLPEDWGAFKKGDMSNGNEPPKIEDNRHTFYQGLFQQTLLPFLTSYQSEKRKIIHMDADIYTATLYVLTLLTPYLRKGDIIFFDEFNVPLHEFKAFIDWSESFYINYKVLGSVNNYYQVGILIQ